MIKCLVIISLSLSIIGCAGFGKKMKSFLRGEKSKPAMQKQASRNYGKRFSQAPNYQKGLKRKYKRTTKATLESESELSDSSGSLWVMEGQGAYLFAQNIMRMIGDPLGIKIDGEPREQLESKVKIITDLLNRLANKRKSVARKLAAAKAAKNKKEPSGKTKAPAKKAANSAGKEKSDDTNLDSKFPVKTVPTRIVERLVDGNYRVKGSQPFMIGKREYNVIVTGIVRAEDFAEDGISSTKLLDPKFDIVSKRRRKTL